MTNHRSKAPHWMPLHSIKAKNCLQTALKDNSFDENFKRCKQDLNESLELDKAVYFESKKHFDLKTTYTLLRSLNGKAKVPWKISPYKIPLYALILQSVRFLLDFSCICTKKTRKH